MNVAIKGRTYVGVSKDALKEFGVFTRLYPERAKGVAQVVEADVFREPGPLEDWLEVMTREILTTHYAAGCVWENEVSVLQELA